MNMTAEQIEYVVREVMRRLAEADAGRPAATGNELALAHRVVTLRDLEGKLAGVTKVSVGAKAIVTPSARDLLREKKIEFVRRST